MSLVCLSSINEWWERNKFCYKNEEKLVILLTCVTFTDSHWQTGKWAKCLQAQPSHGMALTYN
jgi:hypothetical protein